MADITKLPSGRWRARIYDPETGKKKSLGTFPKRRGDDPETCAEAAVRAEHERRRTRKPSASTLTIREWHERWLERGEKEWKRSTYLHYQDRTRHFVAEHGDELMADFERDQALDWISKNRTSAEVIRSMFIACVDAEIIDSHPWRMKKRRGQKRRRKIDATYMPDEKLKRLTDAALALGGGTDDPNNLWGVVAEACIIIPAWTGIRPSELFELRITDIRPAAEPGGTKRLVVARAWTGGQVDTPKNHNEKTITLPKPAEEAMIRSARRAAELGAEGGLVVCTPTGARLRHPSWSPYWRAIKVGAAVERNLRYYDATKHRCATKLIELGASAADVAHQLGHTDGGKLVMSTYAHPEDEYALARIDETWSKAAVLPREARVAASEEVAA